MSDAVTEINQIVVGKCGEGNRGIGQKEMWIKLTGKFMQEKDVGRPTCIVGLSTYDMA